jgi:Uncharacterised nucleotidyltransferase
MHGIAALLSGCLRWPGPALWQGFLADQQKQGRLREQRVAQTLARLDAAARARGVPLVALKGSALLPMRLHAHGERPMADIDLLAGEADLQGAAELLFELGWEPELATPRHLAFVPRGPGAPIRFGEHVDNPLRIELHSRIAERLPLSVVDITPSVWPRAPAPGLNAYASPAALLRHLLLHAAGGMQLRTLRLVQLRDLALLAPRLSASDWHELLDGRSGEPSPWWAWPPLAMAVDAQGLALPPAVRERLQAACPPRLVRAARRLGLEEVSFTQIRIEAFPGLEWARSPAEALRYMAGRVFPDRRLRDLRRHPAVLKPSLPPVAWSRQSQLRRMGRWLVSSPPRVGTLQAIRLALAYEAP